MQAAQKFCRKQYSTDPRPTSRVQLCSKVAYTLCRCMNTHTLY